MSKLKTAPNGVYSFFCPGCKFEHQIWTEKPHPNGSVWGFNYDFDKPTFTPSIHITTGSFANPSHEDPPGIPPTRCHFFINAGQILFLADCTHNLAGKKIDMEDI